MSEDDPENRSDPMNEVFPKVSNLLKLQKNISFFPTCQKYRFRLKFGCLLITSNPQVTKCSFHKYGSSGTVETHDGLCVLPLNIFNEKIYIFLWFWFVAVAVVSGLGLLYRAATFFQPFRQILLRTRCRLASQGDIEAVARKCHIGDWFLLYQLGEYSFIWLEFA